MSATLERILMMSATQTLSGIATHPEFYRSQYEESNISNLDKKIEEIIKQSLNKNKMKRTYKVLKLNELADQLGLPSSKGIKTKDYLEMAIGEIEDRGYGFVQFLQIIDALFVIIDTSVSAPKEIFSGPDKFEPEVEIQNHYNHTKTVLPVSPPIEKMEKVEKDASLENIKKRDHLEKNLKTANLPWKK